MSTSNDDAFLPNPTNAGSGTNQGIRRADYAYDPSNFTFSSAYGNAPSNTTLTVRYIKGGGISSNIAANTLSSQTSVQTSVTYFRVYSQNICNYRCRFTNSKQQRIQSFRSMSLRTSVR